MGICRTGRSGGGGGRPWRAAGKSHWHHAVDAAMAAGEGRRDQAGADYDAARSGTAVHGKRAGDVAPWRAFGVRPERGDRIAVGGTASSVLGENAEERGTGGDSEISGRPTAGRYSGAKNGGDGPRRSRGVSH